jgi:acyl carrier protein
MTKEEFLSQMVEAMDYESELSEEMVLDEIEEWDSLSMLNVLAIFHDNSIDIEVEDLEECKTVKDVIAKANL